MNSESIINRCLHELGEEYEAVQIFATRTENGNTLIVSKGTGNFYTRLGMVHDFIENDKNSNLSTFIKNDSQS